MAEKLPSIEPESARQGDTWKWRKSVTHLGEARRADDGWTLTYTLWRDDQVITITSTVDHGGGEFEVVVAASVTAAYVPGSYAWQATVSKAGEVFTIGAGRLEVLETFAGESVGDDQRTWAQRTLEAVEATLERRATKDQESYSIAGRSLTRMSVTELMNWRDRLAKQVASETRRRRAEQGRDTGAQIRLRM